jgi:hypothetical protein
MMPMDLQDRGQYLSLALFAQKIVSSLLEYVDENNRGNLKPSLQEALESLRNVDAMSASVSHGKLATFTSYEHLRTLDEVWSANERKNAVRMIRAILQGAPKDPNTKEIAEKLVDLFSKLQDQALVNFEHPQPVSPRVMQRLCQLA